MFGGRSPRKGTLHYDPLPPTSIEIAVGGSSYRVRESALTDYPCAIHRRRFVVSTAGLGSKLLTYKVFRPLTVLSTSTFPPRCVARRLETGSNSSWRSRPLQMKTNGAVRHGQTAASTSTLFFSLRTFQLKSTPTRIGGGRERRY